MLKKFVYTLLFLLPGSVLANQPKDWQLGFQKSASQGMEDIVWFHDYMLFLLSSKICCRCIDVELLLSVYLLCVLARHSAVSQKRSFGNGLTLLTLGMKIVTCFSSSWSRQLALSVGSRYHHRSRAQARSLLALSLCHHASCRRKRIRVLCQ